MMRRLVTLFLPVVFILCEASAQGLRQQKPALWAPESEPGGTSRSISIRDSASMQAAPLRISSAEFTRHLPFFCRQELALEKRIKLPVRLRLGSVQQADWLESKPGAELPGR